MKEIIGSKVCELVGNEFSKKMNTEKTFIVVKVKGYDEVDDWCQHYIIRDKDGNEKEIREVDCVATPRENCSCEEEKIAKFLEDNGVYAEVYTPHIIVNVSINGDWKHQHGWGDVLMGYLGYKKVNEEVTETNGSDWYGSIHRYVLAQ